MFHSKGSAWWETEPQLKRAASYMLAAAWVTFAQLEKDSPENLQMATRVLPQLLPAQEHAAIKARVGDDLRKMSHEVLVQWAGRAYSTSTLGAAEIESGSQFIFSDILARMRGTLADLRDSSADSGQVPYMYLSYLWVSVVCNLVERPWATAAREHDELRVELGVSIASSQIEHSVSELSSSIPG